MLGLWLLVFLSAFARTNAVCTFGMPIKDASFAENLQYALRIGALVDNGQLTYQPVVTGNCQQLCSESVNCVGAFVTNLNDSSASCALVLNTDVPKNPYVTIINNGNYDLYWCGGVPPVGRCFYQLISTEALDNTSLTSLPNPVPVSTIDDCAGQCRKNRVCNSFSVALDGIFMRCYLYSDIEGYAPLSTSGGNSAYYSFICVDSNNDAPTMGTIPPPTTGTIAPPTTGTIPPPTRGTVSQATTSSVASPMTASVAMPTTGTVAPMTTIMTSTASPNCIVEWGEWGICQNDGTGSNYRYRVALNTTLIGDGKCIASTLDTKKAC